MHHPSQSRRPTKSPFLGAHYRLLMGFPDEHPLRIPPLSKANLRIPRQPRHLLLHLQESLKLAPPIHPFRITLRMAPPQRNRPLIQHKMDILRLLSLILIPRAIRLHRLRRLNNLNIQAGAKRRNLRHRKIVFARVSVSREVLLELG